MKKKIIKYSILFILIILVSLGISYIFVKNITNSEEKIVSRETISAQKTNNFEANIGYNIDLFSSLSSDEKEYTIDGTVYAPLSWNTDWKLPTHDGFQIYCIQIGGAIFPYEGKNEKTGEDTGCTPYSEMEGYIGNSSFSSCTYLHNHASAPTGSNAVSRTMWKKGNTGILPKVTAYIVSYSDTWSNDKQLAIWNDREYEDNLVTNLSASSHSGTTTIETEAKSYKTHDSKVRTYGINPSNKTNSSSVFTKVNQDTKEYTVGPFNMTYNECKYGDLSFGGISNMIVTGYDKNGTKKENMPFKISLEDINGVYSLSQTPQYFVPNTSTEDYGVDRNSQYYPSSGQNFQIILNDRDMGSGENKIVSISIKVNFEYMLANGAYTQLNGVRYGMHVDHGENKHKPTHADKHFKETIYLCNNKPYNGHYDNCSQDGCDGCKHIHNLDCEQYKTYYLCYECSKEIDKIEVKYYGQTLMVADAHRTIYNESLTLSSKIETAMDLGGYVWEDGLLGKESKADGLNNTLNEDKAIQNIRVVLYDKDNKYITEKRTDTDGYYLFTNLDPMKKYYVAFEYNGQLYVPTTYKKENSDWKNTSKATDKSGDRTAFNNRFAEIGASPNNYKRADGKYNKAYSQYELMGFKLNEDGSYYYDKTQHYVDGFYEIKDGNIVVTDKINPAQVSNGDVQKVNFVNDCKIYAYTKAQDTTNPDLYPSANQFIINKTASQTYATGKQAREITFNTNSVIYAGVTYTPLYPNQFYIDLGLVRRQEVDLALRKDILYTTIKINGKTEIYKYDKRAENNNYWLVQYRMQNYSDYYDGMYINGIYNSDYTYRGVQTNGGNDLEAYVTYKITVRNSSTDILGQITEVVDYYDKDYTYMPNLSWVMYKEDSANENNEEIALNKDNYQNMINNNDLTKIPNAKNINKYNESIYGTKQDIATKMNSIYIRGLEGKKLAVGEQAYIYLTFKINKDGTNPIILDTEDSLKMNYAEINGYKTYYTGNIDLPNGVKKTSKDTAGLIDINSTPGNLCLADINSGNKYEKNFENDTDRAKGIQIAIKKEDKRVINGTVWEDQRTVNVSGTIIGDGVRKDGEIGIEGVTVLLFEKLEDGKEFLWRTTTTNEEGKYEFSDFIPGNYIVRFMYGHNDATVLTINNGGANNVSYNGQDFKSTVYQKEMNGEEISEYTDQYYDIKKSDSFETNFSDARDIWTSKKISIGQKINEEVKYQDVILQGREAVNNYSTTTVKNDKAEILASPYATTKDNTKISELKQKTQMVAETGIIIIEGEYNRTTTIGDTNQEAYNNDHKLNNLDFGLTERPKAQLELNKQISNVRITLANSNVLFDANEAVANLAWIKHKDYDLINKMKDGKYEEYYEKSKTEKYNRYSYKTDINNIIKEIYKGEKNGLIQVTMDSELMHGATIQIIYTLKVKNVGEIDYTGEDFYYKAINPQQLVTTVADKVVDYVPNNLQYRAQDNQGWIAVKAKELIVSENVNSSLADYNTILVTDKMNTVLKPGDEVTKDLVLTQTITAQNTKDNMTYENMAEILQVSNTIGRRMAYSIVGNQDPTTNIPAEVDSAKAENVVILPPFGQVYLYLGLGVVILAVLAGGIIFIKKRVLKK